MNRKELVERLAEEHELTGRFAREIVDSVFDMITTSVQNGEEVSLFGFGTFKVSERAAARAAIRAPAKS
jgi:nucleoid DNA-binding protein